MPNTGYSAIAKALAQQNYYVISIQHELPTDAPIPATGSLDNRRMPFPRTGHPRIYSLRSSDQPADDGVLPTPQQQQQYQMRVIQLKNTIHNDMDDHGTEEQKQEIIRYILAFLNP